MSVSGVSMSSFNAMSQVSMEQMRKDMFSKVDTDGDGKQSKEEVQAMADEMAQKTGRSMDVEELFSQQDTDGDGYISESEFEAGQPDMPPPPMDGQSMGQGPGQFGQQGQMINTLA